MPTNFRTLLEALTAQRVDFVIVGGIALVLQGSTRVTQDLDICYARDDENLTRLAHALAPFRPTLRGAPPDLPFRLTRDTIRSGLNFTLSTSAGDLDLLGEITGIGQYPQLAPTATRMRLFGLDVLVMSLDELELAKRAAGRLKDLLDLDELRKIRERQKK